MFATREQCTFLFLAMAIPIACQALNPAPIDISGALLTPNFSLKQGYHDNVLFQPADEVISSSTVVKPELDLSLERGRVNITSNLGLEAGRFWQSSEDNYNNLNFLARLVWQASSRNQFNVASSFARKNERRGTGFSAGSGSFALRNPENYEDTDLVATYRYGAKSARGRLKFSGKHSSMEYTARREITEVRNRDVNHLTSAFFFGIGGCAAALVELDLNTTDYEADPGGNALRSLDSIGRAYLFGFNWQATSKTEADIRIGFAQKDFDSEERESFSGASWRASAKWSPKNYSSFNLKTGRRPIETDASASFIVEQTWSFDWRHTWGKRFSTIATANLAERDYKQSLEGRDESINKFGVLCLYSVKRWLDLVLELAHEQKNSNLAEFEYESNLATFNLTMSL